jgi:hypothetical protein
MEPFFELRDEVRVLPAFVKKQNLHRFFLSVAGVRAPEHERHVGEIDTILFNVVPIARHQSPQWFARSQHRLESRLHPFRTGRIGLCD